eukprot:NODE_342_length_9153_cov_0.637376.p7 type:complete len:152 gc:universal NODE_342_length_9153_cov_0.637376:6970-6515(-)
MMPLFLSLLNALKSFQTPCIVRVLKQIQHFKVDLNENEIYESTIEITHQSLQIISHIRFEWIKDNPNQVQFTGTLTGITPSLSYSKLLDISQSGDNKDKYELQDPFLVTLKDILDKSLLSAIWKKFLKAQEDSANFHNFQIECKINDDNSE